MNDELIEESVSDYGYFDKLRSNVGYGPTRSLTYDWTRGAALSMAHESSAEDDDFFNSYPFFMFDADARTSFMINMNIGQLKADQDRMAAANQDATRAQSLLDQIEELKQSTNDEDIAKLLKTTDAYTGLLHDGKFDSNDVTENLNKLQSIIDDANAEYQDAYEEQMTDLLDIEDWNNSHTVSGYYTRKSKQESKLGNWFYTLPSTQGLSSSSWKEQAMSLAAGVGTSMAANAIVGGTLGSSVGPLGTAAGAGTGALVGAAIGIGSAIMSQIFGGAQAREQESHMEAFDAYQNSLLDKLAESGVDTHEAATSIREQAKALGYPNLDTLSDEDIIGMAAADTRFKYDFNKGLEFARAMDEAYVGTRRVYERNNALGAAEFATDAFMFTPLKPLAAAGKGFFSPLANATRKYNPITYLQDLTMKTNLDISKLAGKMRLRAIGHYGKGLLTRQGLNFVEESTEEGAQDIIQKEYAAGEYADEYASDSLIDAIFNGNIISDMTDNLLFRTESGLSFLGLGSEYSNDVQQQEQMWSGGLMALLSPQGAVMTAKNFADTYKGVESAYGMGKYIQEALQKNSDLGGIEAFYRNMRKYNFVNSSNYEQTLNFLRDELKSAKTSKDGHTTRRWKFDTDAIHKILEPVNANLTDADGNPIRTNSELTDADIDEYIDGQAKMARELFANKKETLDPAWKRIKGAFTGPTPTGSHTTEELNQLSDLIDKLQEEINSGTLGSSQLKQSNKKLKELKRQYKRYSKNAVDTDTQDAYYALATISMWNKRLAQKNRDDLTQQINQIKENLHNNIDYDKLRTAMGVKSDVDNALLFDLLWSNQSIRMLKLSRAKFEADFLAALRAALNGNAPIELSRAQRNALRDIDELIEAEDNARKQYKEIIDTLDDAAKTEMTDLFNFGLKSAAQFSADDQTNTFNNTLQVAFNNSTLSPEDMVRYITTRDESIASRINAIQAESNLNTLLNGDPKEIKALIEQYKKAKNESFQSQQAAENEQNTGKPANQLKFSSIRNWLIEAMPEQIGERIDEVDANLTKAIDLFDDFVSALPEDSPLSESLNKALNFANAIQNAANGSKVSKVRALQYQLQDLRRQFEGSTDPQITEVLGMVDNMIQNIIDINILNDEAKARQTEYYIPGKFLGRDQKPLKVDNRTFVDNAGNFYNVDLSKSVYSENNGLVLRLIQINGNKDSEKKQLNEDIKRLNTIIKDYKNQANGLKTQLAAIPRQDIKDKLNAVNRQIDLALKALEETKKALDNVDVERKLDVKYGDPLLDELHYTNNDGSTMTMNLSYKLTNDIVTEQGKSDRSRRLHNPGVSPVNYQNVRELTGNQIRKEIGDLEEENEQSEIKRAIAYSLMDGNNQKAAAILSSPYYKAKYWFGWFDYTMDDSEVDRWKTVSDDRKNAAKRSIKLFNKLVKQSAYLKTINRPDILKKFLDDLDAMLQVPVPDQNPNDTVTLESADPAKPEYAISISRRELIEIIRFLPMKAKLQNPRYKNKDNKLMTVPLVLADIKNESNAYNEDGKLSTKFQWRYGMVKSFLQQAHQRKKENEKPTNEQELRDLDDANSVFDKSTGFDDSAERESANNRKLKPYASTITIKPGSIEITFEKYNLKFDSPQFNPESQVFYDPDGKRLAKLPDTDILNQKDLIAMYTLSVQNMMTGMSEFARNAAYSEFATVLSDILGTTVTVEQLKQTFPDTELTVLEKIILDGVLYGDGVILRDSFAKNTVSNTKVFGEVKYKSTASVQQSVEKNLRTNQLFELIEDRFANLFLSHKNPNLQRGTKQKVDSETISKYLQDGYFNKVGDRKGGKPGSVRVLIEDSDGTYRVLGDRNNPVKTSSTEIAELFNKLDDLIDDVNNPQQFFDAIKDMGIKFQFTPNPSIKLTDEEREAHAIDLISRYIRNRQFGRLSRVSSFTDMLISGTDHPNNDPVANLRFFAMKGQVINSNLDKINCLHIKEVDGVYYFDLADFASKSVRNQDVDDAGNTSNTITDAEAERNLLKQTEDTLNQEIEDLLNSYKTLDDIVAYFNSKYEVYHSYKSFRNLYDDLQNFDLNELGIDDKTSKLDVKDKLLDAVDELHKEFRQMRERIDERLADILREDAPAEERLTFTENGRHARVQFAIGSYNERTGNARILRGDESGNFVAMNEAVGQPGGVYLIVPSFMNSSGKRRIVHLNGRKLGIHQANLIARLLDAVRTGKISYNGNIPTDLIPGYTIKTQATVNQLLEALINIGTKTIENDSSARAFANLLFVDNSGQIHFGSEVLNDSNLSDLIQFLQDKKQIRVDRAKLLNERASVGLDVDIQLTDDSEFIKGGIVKDKSVFELNADENYQHYVISKGVVRSDLNPDKNARMYTNVICAINTPFTGNDAIPNPSNPKTSGSAASARNAAAETFVSPEEFKNNVIQQGLQQTTQLQTQYPAQTQLVQQLATTQFSESLIDSYLRSKFNIQGSYTIWSKKGIEYTISEFSSTLNEVYNTPKPDGSRYRLIDSYSIVLPDGSTLQITVVFNDVIEYANAIQQPVAQPFAQPAVQPQYAATPIVSSAPTGAFTQTASTPVAQPAIPSAASLATPTSLAITIQPAAPTAAPVASTTPTAPAASGFSQTPATPMAAPQAATQTAPISDVDILLQKVVHDLLNETTFNDLLKLTNHTDARAALTSMILNRAKKYNKSSDLSFELVRKLSNLSGDLGTLFTKVLLNLPNYGVAAEFLDKHVEKEDYASAQKRAIKILGDPEIVFTSDLPFTYDSNRRAFVYVFGQCAESFMRIYRSANGEIAQGVMDHEAFHRISLFVLSEKERKRMYDDVRKAHPETENMTDQQVEEFAADLFRDFVGEYSKQGVDGFYSKNGFIKFFQKLYDLGAKMLRKLFGIRTNPNYRGLQKLFEDMYSGRYAYAKATKDNIRLFNMLYRTAPMSGVKTDKGVIVAKNVSQYNQILRTLLDHVVNDSKLLDTVHNYTDIDSVMDSIKLKLIADNNGLENRARLAYIEDKIDDVVRWINLTEVYNTILTDEAWAAWKKIINDTLRRQFKISNQRRDPNQLLDVMEDGEVEYQIESYEDDTEETTESEGIEDPVENDNDGLNLGFEGERDSHQRNMWNSAALSVKILFYTVTSEDSRNNKYDANGLLNYGDPIQLYIKFTDILQNCMSEEEMMSVLADNCDDAEVASIYEHLTKDNDPEVNKSLQNKFFTSVCRYQLNFENNVYDVETDSDGYIVSVEARSVSGNMNEITTKTRSVIQRSIINALVRRGTEYKDSKWNSTNAQKELEDATTALKRVSDNNETKLREAVLQILKLQYEHNGFGMFVEGDYDLSQSTDMVMGFLWDKDLRRVNVPQKNTFITVLNIITNNITSITPSKINDEFGEGKNYKQNDNSISALVQKIVDENVHLQNFFKNIGMYAPRQSKMMSQNGPKNVRIYTIGAFNYITRLFKLWTKPHKRNGKLERTDWKEYLLKNPYAEHSLWLRDRQLPDTKMNTRLQTMNDGDFSSAKSDKFALDKEEYINRMVTVLLMDDKGEWLGGHAFPVLANKKFSADLPGLPIEGLKQVVSMLKTPEGVVMQINEGAKTIFANYFLDELAAIRQAKQTRDNFIKAINDALGTDYTIESFSNLGVSEQRDVLSAKSLPESQRQDAIAKINDALRTLTVTYHFKSSKTEAVRDSKNRIVSYNDAHIDLTKGSGYKHRHFQQIANQLADAKVDIDTLTADNDTLRRLVAQMLIKQIKLNNDDIINTQVRNCIPINLVNQFAKKYVGLNHDLLVDAMIATFVVRHMSDMLEYEKLVQGDMAYYGDGSTSKKYKSTIDKMTKRYAGPVSTFGQNASSGTKPMSLTIDNDLNLTNESTYNTITVQTTKLIDYDVYEGLIKKALGIDVTIDYGKDTVDPQIDYTQLLDENGKIKQLVLSGVFAPYKYFLNTFDDKTVAIAIIKDVLNRYEGYLSQDYTDASTFISPSMFRELRQRSDDGWTETEEACYLFMEHYDQLYDISTMPDQTDWETMKRAAHTLGISDAELDELVIDCRNLYNRERETRNSEYWNVPEFRKQRAKYRGRILSYLEDENGNPKIDTTAMKYIHYGNRPQEGENVLYIPIFDKTALAPLFKIFTEDHEAEHMYNLMHDRNIHVMKYDSSTKSGGIFGYQLYDEHGNFNQDLYNAPTTTQWFAQLSKQLDTDMHIHNDTNLLTQITKVIMLNSILHDYNFGGKQVSGSEMNQLYSAVFNSLTKEGFNRFRESFGFDENGNLDAEGKQKLVSKLRQVLEESGASQTVIDAFELDQNGDFVVNPALLPSMNQMQSRLLSQIGKIIVDTHMKGLPMYQIVSVGFDQDHPLKKGASFDPELLSPGDIDKNGKVVTRMQARVSIMLFNDVINEAKKNKALSRKYHGLTNFEDKRRFILDNKDQLCSIAYRVPTQGQNSTMAIDIVDVLPSTQGGIIQLPTTLTALTGADFDIDKLFTATYNYEVTDDGIRRISYNDKYKTVEDLIAHIDELNSKQKENLLLDIYQTVLTSNENLLHTSTPLDVCTAPIKNVMTQEIPDSGVKNNNDGFSLTPMHQVRMRVLNSGSDSTIGPMALNSVFQYFTQSCDLGFINDPQLEKIGIKAPGMEYIRSLENNEDGQLIMRIAYILDTTSAMINAAVDAAKDNYIGRSNINAETFDVVNLLIACGFGNNSFRFLAQPGVINYVNMLLNASKDAIFKEKATREDLGSINLNPELFTTEALRQHMNDPLKDMMQGEYVKAYIYFKSIAQRYRQAITVAQVDTKKYGKNPTELMSFLQNVDDFTSVYNLIFSTPNNLFEQSFLKEKLNAVRTATDMFGNIFMENSKLFKDAAELMCTIFNKRGSYSKKFLQRVIPKLKQSVLKGFFDSYITNRFPLPDGSVNVHPLYTLFCDNKQSVIARYDRIHELCVKEGIGFDFFDMIKHAPIRKDSGMPKFFVVDNKTNGNAIVKQKITDSIAELFHSENPEVRQWITDVAVMQFYQTGGTDTSFGTAVRSSFYDMLPIRELANIEARQNDGSTITLNDYIANNPYANDVTGLVNQAILQLSISDDEFVKLFRTYRNADKYGADIIGDGSIVVLKKHAAKARTDANGARYAKYIKIQVNRTATPALYVLGNVLLIDKNGKTYHNPVYFRVSRLGFQQYYNRSNSIRVDGTYYNNQLISLFNSPLFTKSTNGKMVPFGARNVESLDGYAIQNDFESYLKRQKADGITTFDVDDLGNVSFGGADPYFGMFNQNNPKSTNLVLSRLDQAPSDFNAAFVQRAKELGTTFQQLVRTENGYEFIGTDKELEDEVSLLVNSGNEIDEAANAIFDRYPYVSSVKFIYDGQIQVIMRSSRDNIGEYLKNRRLLVTRDKYNRSDAAQDQDSLYIFTDNTDRTSGGKAPMKTWYTDAYDDVADPTGNYPVGGYGSSSNPTTAVVRGLPNAAPISTMKWFYKKHGLKNTNSARWTDKDYDEVRTVVELELENIQELLRSGKFRRIVIPNNDFLLNSGIADISEKRTPRLYEYFQSVQERIMNLVSPDSEFVELLNNIELNKDSEEQRNKKC